MYLTKNGIRYRQENYKKALSCAVKFTGWWKVPFREQENEDLCFDSLGVGFISCTSAENLILRLLYMTTVIRKKFLIREYEPF